MSASALPIPNDEGSVKAAATPIAREDGCGAASCALSELGIGECAVVQASALGEGDAAALKAMGLRPEARVRVCRIGEPCIVEVGAGESSSCRIGLSRTIALRVMVRREAIDGALHAGAR